MSIKSVFFLLVCACFPLTAYIDLEEMSQSFVLETKKIDIPGYPNAFNPSIARWKNRLLLCFRTRDPVTNTASIIGLVQLDEDFNPIGTPQILKINFKHPTLQPMTQDPRLITVGDTLYMVFNDMINPPLEISRRMCIGIVQNDGEKFFIENPDFLLDYENKNNKIREKNWIPFEYKQNLLLAYSINPHLIFHPWIGTNKCETFAYSKGSFVWEWGELRGGTPALLDGDEYLAFFHTCKSMPTVHSQGKKIDHYFMGAYTFAANPPFNLTRVSPEPIVGKKFYHGPAYNTWKPLRVVFPGGMIISKDTVWVVYGRQDHEVWIVTFDKKGLLDSLIPVTTLE